MKTEEGLFYRSAGRIVEIFKTRNGLLAAALSLLAGCSTSTQPSKRPPLPANLAAPCPDIVAPAGESWDDLGKAYIGLVGQYADCAMRPDATVSLW